MQRKFLEELKIGDQSLTKEQIDSIMAENGKDIEATKAKADKSQEIENLKSQLSEKDKLIEEANVQIENFKGMDVEGIKKQLTSTRRNMNNQQQKQKPKKLNINKN